MVFRSGQAQLAPAVEILAAGLEQDGAAVLTAPSGFWLLRRVLLAAEAMQSAGNQFDEHYLPGPSRAAWPLPGPHLRSPTGQDRGVARVGKAG